MCFCIMGMANSHCFSKKDSGVNSLSSPSKMCRNCPEVYGSRLSGVNCCRESCLMKLDTASPRKMTSRIAKHFRAPCKTSFMISFFSWIGTFSSFRQLRNSIKQDSFRNEFAVFSIGKRETYPLDPVARDCHVFCAV